MRGPFWFLTSTNIKPVISWGFQSLIHLDMGSGSSPRNPFNAEKLLGGDILPKSKIGAELDFEYIELDLTGDIPLLDESLGTLLYSS